VRRISCILSVYHWCSLIIVGIDNQGSNYGICTSMPSLKYHSHNTMPYLLHTVQCFFTNTNSPHVIQDFTMLQIHSIVYFSVLLTFLVLWTNKSCSILGTSKFFELPYILYRPIQFCLGIKVMNYCGYLPILCTIKWPTDKSNLVRAPCLIERLWPLRDSFQLLVSFLSEFMQHTNTMELSRCC